MGNAVSLQDISKSYKKIQAIKRISLDIPRGVLFGFIGPDGAGKSTLLKIIAGILTYDSGNLIVLGQKVRSEKEAEIVKKRLCFMPQGLGVSLYQELSIEENLNFFGHLRLLSREELEARKEKLLALTGLSPFRNRRAKDLSGGMKQKLALICSIIHEPELIILDEPTTGVDPLSREDFWFLIGSLVSQRGITALVSTTYLEEAERFDLVALIHGGEVLAHGNPKEILSLAKGRSFLIHTRDPLSVLNAASKIGLRPFPYAGGLKVFVPERDIKLDLLQILDHKKDIKIQELPIDLQDVVFSLSFTEEKPVFPENLGISKHKDIPIITESVIVARKLTKEFGKFRAVDSVDLEVRRGEIYGLLGPNGAGKTTLIRMLCGLLPPNYGEGKVAGFDMRRAPRHIKEHIGYLSQAFSLYRDLTVRENLWLMGGIYGLSSSFTKRRISELLSLTGLLPYEDMRAGDLPLGLRQRLALACAVIHKPDIVFLDEPTSGVDVAGRQVFWSLIYRLSRETGLTCLVTTHYLAEAEYCDRLALMHDGKIVVEGPPERLKEDIGRRLGSPWMIEVENPLLAMEILREKVLVSIRGRRIRFFYRGEIEEVLSFLDSLDLRPLCLEKGFVTMEDVFLSRIKGEHAV